MKTIAKTLIVLGILMLSLQSIAGPGISPGSAQITYKVQILGQPPHIQNLNFNLYIYMTDQNNRLIGPPQQFKRGTYTYFFYEPGPVKGTRVAHMVNDTRYPTTLYSFYCAPSSLSGGFAPGEVYTFDLYPVITINR